MNAPVPNNTKAELLQNVVEHIDITSFDARPIIDSMRKMSFSSRDTARAADILNMALADKGCSPWLILAGSTSAGGCMHVYRDMVKNGMIDAVVATGALDRRHGLLRGPGLQALSGRRPGRRQRAARQLHRPHLRHLYRRGRAPELRSHDPGDRAIAWSRAPIPRASSSGKWASGCRKATPRSPAR